MKSLFIFISIIFYTSIVYSDPVTIYRDRQKNSTPESVLKWLIDGNTRFANGKSVHGGYTKDARERIKVSASSQRPLAAVLSCIDSRTTPEIVFDTSVGDLFTPRVGGNVISHEILGSLEVSVASGVKVVVVLGHKDCGAVKGACRGVEFEHLTKILNKVKPAIAKTNDFLDANPEVSSAVGERVPENKRYIAQISHMNAKQSLQQILARSSYLKTQVDSGAIKLISAIYDVSTGKVEFDQL